MFSEEDYIKGISSIYTDPRDYNVNKIKCCKCDIEAEEWDDRCFNHQICQDCGDYNNLCRCSFYIEQYNRNRSFKDHVKQIHELDY